MTHVREILRFQLVRQLKRPMVWLFIAVFGYLAYLVARDGSARAADVFSNSPVDVAAYAIILGMISLVVAAVLASEAAARDVQTRMDPLVYALPLGGAEYILGRFLAAFLIHAALLLVTTVGLALMPVVAWDDGLAGVFRAESYVRAYFVYMLPNALAAQTLMFAAATVARRAIAAWGVGALVFFLSLFVPEFIGGQLGHWTFARWFDPSGYATARLYMDTWAPAQQNTLQLPLAGIVAGNRLVWLAIALLTMAAVIARFRFEHHAPRVRRSHVDDTEADAAAASAPPASVTPHFDPRARVRQLAGVFAFSLRQIVQSRAALLLVAGPVLFFLIVPESLEHIGVPLDATTSRIVLTIKRAAFITTTVPLLVLAFFTGELIWAEREARLSSMTDAAPVPDWVLMAGKLLALLPLILFHQALLLGAAVGVQRVLGFTDHDIGLYAQSLFGFAMLDVVLFAALAVAAHALAPHKFVGHLVLAVVWIMSHRMQTFGIEHDLLAYAAAPAWSHSDMTGFGWSLGPWLWHKLYWLGWALLLLVLARVIWPRGAESGLRARATLARQTLRRSAPLAAAAAAIVLVTGGFVFWNTNVLNEHQTPEEGADRRAAYERTYRRFARMPQPVVSAMSLRVELYPSRGSAQIGGRYTVVNRNATPLDTLLVAPSLALGARDVRFDRPAHAAAIDRRLGHQIWVLERPLAPGDSMAMSFEIEHAPRGFGGLRNPIVANGAVIDNEDGDWLPRFGYQTSRELVSATERRKRGMAPRPALTALEDTAARYDRDGASATMLDIVIGTDSAHTAVAPGELRRTWAEGGRRWFHYTTDVPVRDSWVIMSARYARNATSWQNVGIEVLHHPEHTTVVDHVLRSARSSLAYFSEQFGPYPYPSLRFVERPGYGGGANAHPGFIDYDEALALMDAKRDPRSIDFVFGVMAHEIAHQWWGHLMTPAIVEGAPLLTESLAWYSALGAIEREFGAAHLDRMLAMLRESYLTPRARAGQPLLRADDWFEAYRKGPFAMQALREYVGEERVNGALRSMLERFTAPGAPLPTSLDLYDELRAVTPDSMQYLVHDLFAANTYWTLWTDTATAEPLGDGRWRVTLDVRASKAVVDTAGVETAVPMNDIVEIGVFRAATAGERRGAPLYLQRHRIRTGPQRIVVEVSGEPALAGIDPRALLIDTHDADNVLAIGDVR